MFTPEQYAEKAAEMWQAFTPNERALVAMAIFPAEKMEAAEALGYKTHPLVVALMDHHRNQPRPQPTRRRR
jgi:uncharacterized protein YqcC (DUF446 family)